MEKVGKDGVITIVVSAECFFLLSGCFCSHFTVLQLTLWKLAGWQNIGQ